MAIKIYDQLLQGSDEWLQARCGVLTASVVGQLITAKTVKRADNETSRTLTRHLAAERITSYVEPTFTSADMERGNLSEPLARDIYSKRYEPVHEVGFIIQEADKYRLGYSPDGLVGDHGLIEIKAPRQKKHLAILLANEVPLEYMGQIQTGLLVTGREWLDFISYCGGFPLFVKRVHPDPRWFATIKDAASVFEENVSKMVADYQAIAKGEELMERVDVFDDVELNL